MTELKFEPDYALWWKKKNLKPEQAYALALGVNPDMMKKAIALSQKNPVSDEERIFWDAFSSYTDQQTGRPPHEELVASAQKMVEENCWGSGKKEFLRNLYEKAIPTHHPSLGRRRVHPEFIAFLQGRNEWPTHWDHYKNHDQYRAALKDFNSVSVKTKQQALAIILELDPEWHKKYNLLENKKRDMQPLSNEEQFFQWEYWSFLKSHEIYGDGWIGWRHRLTKAGEKLNYTGDFAQYIQALYDEGVIFPRHHMEFIRTVCPSLAYSSGSWASTIVSHWHKQGIWSFSEACHYYAGYDPHSGRQFIDGDCIHKGLYFRPRGVKRAGLGDIFFDSENEKVWNGAIGDFEDLRDLANRHVLSRSLHAEKVENGEMWFKPVVIVGWLKKNTCFLPPPALEEALFPKKGCIKKSLVAASQAEHQCVFNSIQAEGKNLPRDGENGEEAEMRKRLAPKGFDQGYYRTLRNSTGKKPGRPRKKTGS